MADNVYALLQQAWSVSKTSDASMFGVEVAIVTNTKDPEKGGRVKICFPRLPGKPESDWARVAQPSAGPGRGFYWLPEVNDEVLVAFERGQTNLPFVLGALWNGKDKPMKDAYTDENTTRMIQTRSGHQIVLSDKDGEEKMTFADGSGKRTLTFDVKEKKFLIEAKEGDVEIHAQKKLVLQCEDLEIKTSKTGKIEIGSKFDLKVAQKASFKAGPKFEMKADKVNLNPPSLSIEALVTAAEEAVAAAAAAAGAAAAAAQKQQSAAGAAPAGPGTVPTSTPAGGGGAPAAGVATGAASATGAQPAGAAAPAGAAWTKAGGGATAPAPAAAAASAAATPVAADQIDVQLVSPTGKAQKNLEVEFTLPDGDKRAGLTDDNGHFRVEGLTVQGNAKLKVPDVQKAPAAPASAAGRVRYVGAGIDVLIGQSTVVELPPRVRRARMKGMHFELDKTFLLPGAMAGIRQLVKLYQSFPSIVGLVNGHADKTGDSTYNRDLSTERAEVIKAFLLDDAESWAKSYAKRPTGKKWDVREDQHMLATVKDKDGTPFFAGPVGGDASGAYTRFQHSRLIDETGGPNPETRQRLVEAYMALEGTSLPKDSPLETHGCGATHPVSAVLAENRRVEVFLFEEVIAPAPKTPCLPKGCDEYAQWVEQKILDVDLDLPPGSAAVKVIDESKQDVPGAHVHLSGPLALDADTQADGVARFDELIPGDYTAIANADGFSAADAPVQVPSGAAGSTTLTLKLEGFDLEVLVVDDQGKPNPVAGAQVSISAKGVAPQPSGGDGKAKFTKLPPGKHVLTATHDAFVQGKAEVVLGGGAAAPAAKGPGDGAAAKGVASAKKGAPAEKTVVLAVVAKPVLNPAKLAVVVKRTGIAAKPASLHLKTDRAFDGTGLFTRSDANIDFFRKGSNTPLKFDGTDNKLTGAELTAGVDLDASGVKASAAADEITLTLALTDKAGKAGPSANIKATSVEVTVDICEPRVDAATAPVKLPTLAPGAAAPAAGTGTDKLFLGRPLPLQANPRLDERAMLIVQQLKPSGFKGTLVLKAENDKLALFADEEPKPGETARALPEEIDSSTIPATGKSFFVEGAKASTAARDAGITVGLKGVADVADQVKFTVCHTETCSNKKPADLHLVAQAAEKPARTTKSTFVPAPLIIGQKYDVEMRPFMEIAKPNAFKWKTASNKIVLKNDGTEVVGVHGDKLSAALDDVLLEVFLTTDLGKLKKRHKLTVVAVEMDPITTGDNLLHTDNLNKIENPSGCVILTGAAAGDAANVPIYKITKITPDLGWTADDSRLAWRITGGEAKGDEKYDGKADFKSDNASKYGKKIQVFGTQPGDVLIQPYSGGYGFGMFRANVVPIHRVKFRVNRILTKAQVATPAVAALPEQKAQPAFPGTAGVPAQPAVPHLPAVAARTATAARAARTPTTSHAEAALHIKVTNIYLRQAGIEMIPDDSAEVASPTRAATAGLPAVAAQPAIAAQPATPALAGIAPQPAVPVRSAVPALPAVPAQAASAANTKVGDAALDNLVESVTRVSPGFFDVEVNLEALTFNASGPRSNDAIRINDRNEVVSLAYIHSDASGALAVAKLRPWNHAPLARVDPPRAYTQAAYTMTDKSTPSSSLIPKTGIPDDVPVDPVKLIVFNASGLWVSGSPATRQIDLLWGVIVPTLSMDSSAGAGATADKIRLVYGNTLAHELGHVFGLRHRVGAGNDGLATPPGENLMHGSNPPPQAENIDVVQVKAIQFSELLFRTP